MEGRNKKATENSSQLKMFEVETSSDMKACQSKHEPESPVCTSSVLMTPYKGVVEAVFIKEERVWDESVTEVCVKEENEYYRSEVPLQGRETECALSQEVRVNEEWNCPVSQEVRVKVERVSESSEDEESLTVTEENKERLSAKKEREHCVSVGGVRIKEENVEVDIEKEFKVFLKEEVELSPGAADVKLEANCDVVLGPEGPQPQDIFFSMQDSTHTTNPERSHHTEELLVPTCSVKLKPDSTEPAFEQIPSVIRPRTTLTRKARTENKTYTCDYCGKQFATKPNLISHIMIHMGIKRYSCDTCNKAYTNLYNLKRHKLIHTGLKPYSCELCEKRFTDPCNLVIHRRTHHEREKFTCKICNKQFKQNHSLKSHRRVHTGDKPFSCEICKRSFSNSSNLKRHHIVHTGVKPHPCEICKKGFYDVRGLTKHKKTHAVGYKRTRKRKEENMSNECKICNKVFKAHTHLKYHNRIHTGYKPFPCEICGKSFSNSFNLKRHSYVHSGFKPYACDLCPKKYAARRELTKHKLKHTVQQERVEIN